ncbi:hypothetical protein AX17_005291 [Amanita inopinata Kibby_2008]|nr:hypothetical protein AX17_005291 [Amanita inopinata Kibby_2008]
MAPATPSATFGSFTNRFLMSPKLPPSTPLSPDTTTRNPKLRRAQTAPALDEYLTAEHADVSPGPETSNSILRIVIDEVNSPLKTPASIPEIAHTPSIETAPILDLPPRLQAIDRNNVNPGPQSAPIIPSTFISTNVGSSGVDINDSVTADSSSGISRHTSHQAMDPLLPQLPSTFIGLKHTSRQADGGGNNIFHPEIGRAGMPYARNVLSDHCFEQLPEPGLVFDTLLKARNQRVHPSGASSLVYAFAQLVSYTLFHTDIDDWTINGTSSYLDLSPLYGTSETARDQVRNKESGRGLLHPDTFAEDRLVFAPPAVSALLVIFNRNHNFIAERLLSINERKRWTDPPPMDDVSRAKQDEEIFQIARLVNCGHFLTVMTCDFLPAFIGLFEDDSWNRTGGFDLPRPGKQAASGRSSGNHCSVEFNMLYKWHATMSQLDVRWMEDRFNQLFRRKSYDKVTVDELEDIIRQYRSMLNADPRKRTFSGLTRGIDGKFDDDELANILLDATENPAGTFRARGIPVVLRAAEILGIEQARFWAVCSMNEFRTFLGLKPFESFEEWCSDSVIASTARRLYGHIDNLELYTGLQCESSKSPEDSSSRYACGYTMAKALLADATRLVQGDRFYTTDFTPRNLTAWGYKDCQRDTSNGSFGGQLSRLLLRHLQRHYPYDSIYGCFPFFTPQKMKESLTKQGIAERYTFDRPVAAPIPKVLDEFTSIKFVLNDSDLFPPVHDLKAVQDGEELMLSVEPGNKSPSLDKICALEALFPNMEALLRHGQWFRESMSRKIKERSWKYGGIRGTNVDIVTDVINASSVEWVAEHLFGLPLKTNANPAGMYTEGELYDILSKLYSLKYTSDVDNEHSFSLRQSAIQASHVVLTLIAKEIMALKQVLSPKAFVERITGFAGQKRNEQGTKASYQLLHKLANSGKPIDELVTIVFDIALSCSVNIAQAAIHAVDFYLDEEQEKERHHILELLQLDDAESAEVLLGYGREALRFNPRICSLWREAATDIQIPQGQDLSPLNVHAGDRIWISFKNASLHPAQFPEPMEIDPRRPRTAYRVFGSEFFSGPIAAFGEQVIVEVLRVVLRLRGLRRAEGDAGRMSGFRTLVNETELNVYLRPDGSTSSWPGPMRLVFDD